MAYNAIIRFALGAALAAAFTSVGAQPQSAAPLPPGLAPLPADLSPPADPNPQPPPPPPHTPPAVRKAAGPAAASTESMPAQPAAVALPSKPSEAAEGKAVPNANAKSGGVSSASADLSDGATKKSAALAVKPPAPKKRPRPKAPPASKMPNAGSATPPPAPAEPDGLVVVEDRPFVAAAARDAQVKSAAAAIAGWEAKPGSTARTTLLAWAAKAGWTVQWDAPNDFPIVAALSYGGSFESAVSAYFDNYTDASRTDKPISVDLYRSNRIVHVFPKIKGPKS